MEVSQKNWRVTIWFSNPTTGYISKANGIGMLHIQLHSHVHCNTLYNSQECSKLSVHQLINGQRKCGLFFPFDTYAHTYNGALKNNKVLSFVAMLLALEIIILSSMRQAQKDTTWYSTHKWNLKKLISWKLRVELWLPGQEKRKKMRRHYLMVTNL